MQIAHTVRIAARPEEVFGLYENVAAWATWDPEVAEASCRRACGSGRSDG